LTLVVHGNHAADRASPIDEHIGSFRTSGFDFVSIHAPQSQLLFGGDESSPCHLVKEHCQSVPFGYQRPADGLNLSVLNLMVKLILKKT